MAPPRDFDDYEGKDRAYFRLPPQIRDELEQEPDMHFRELFNTLFDSSEWQKGVNWDEAHDVYRELRDYMWDEYDIDIDDWFNWDDWRAERAEHGMSA
jgi:hypothetical protein